MSDLISAAKQALEALEIGWSPTYVNGVDAREKGMKAIKSLRQAIAEAEKQEPVAYMYPDDLEDFKTREMSAHAYSLEMVSPTQGETVPLYTHSQPKREPLTVKEMNLIAAKWHLNLLNDKDKADVFAAFRAVEAAHGIKGEA